MWIDPNQQIIYILKCIFQEKPCFRRFMSSMWLLGLAMTSDKLMIMNNIRYILNQNGLSHFNLDNFDWIVILGILNDNWTMCWSENLHRFHFQVVDKLHSLTHGHFSLFAYSDRFNYTESTGTQFQATIKHSKKAGYLGCDTCDSILDCKEKHLTTGRNIETYFWMVVHFQI